MRPVHLAVLPLFLAGALAACGGAVSGNPPGGSGSVSGTVANTTFTIGSELAIIQTSSSTVSCMPSFDGGSTCSPSSNQGRGVIVLFTNRSDVTCAALQSEATSNTNVEFANFNYVEVAVNFPDGDLAPGTYPIVASADIGSDVAGATAEFGNTTATCAEGLNLSASSGTVTLTQVSSTSVTGSYDVTFGTQGTFSGSFDMDICVQPSTTASGGQGPTVCKQ